MLFRSLFDRFRPLPKRPTHPATSVYISSGPAIVAPKYGCVGIYWEQEKPILLPTGYDPALLGASVKKAFELFAVRRPPNFRNRKMAGWPALRVSKCRSGKSFQQEFVHIEIYCKSPTSSMVEAEIWSSEPTGKKALVSIDAIDSDFELGNRLIELADNI